MTRQGGVGEWNEGGMARARRSGLFKPELFERAAELVEERGWHGASYPEEIEDHRPLLARVCIFTAVGEAIDEAVEKRFPSDQHPRVVLTHTRESQLRGDLGFTTTETLLEFFNLDNIGQLFTLNDTEGSPEWTVHNLREIAAQLREAS